MKRRYLGLRPNISIEYLSNPRSALSPFGIGHVSISLLRSTEISLLETFFIPWRSEALPRMLNQAVLALSNFSFIQDRLMVAIFCFVFPFIGFDQKGLDHGSTQPLTSSSAGFDLCRSHPFFSFLSFSLFFSFLLLLVFLFCK